MTSLRPTSTSRQEYLIALGANMPSKAGPPAATLEAALADLAGSGAEVEAVSRFYHTPCFPPGAGPDFVNAAARLGFSGDPQAMIGLLHRVEERFGRVRDTRWGQRTLDLDLIAAGACVLPDAEDLRAWIDMPLEHQKMRAPDRLLLPHPRLQDRAFVLVPLRDIAPDWRHPLLGQTVAEMCEALPAVALSDVVMID